MEKLKPQKQRSVISSLKFQRKTDYKKFLKFIKLETKRLKGIEKPKESKVKDILNAGTIGLSAFGIFSLIGKGRDAINKIKGVQDDFQTPFAVGRVRDTDLKKTISINDSIRTSPINKKKFSPFISQKIKVREKSPFLEKPVKVEQPSFFTKKLTVKKNLVQTPSRTPFTPIETPVTTGSGSGSGQGGGKKINKGTSKIDYGTYVYKPKKGLSVEDFLKRQDTYINEMKKQLSYQTTRADQLKRAYGTAGFEGESSAGAGAGGASRKPSFKQPTLDDLLFGKDGDKPLKIDKPLKMRAEMVFEYAKIRLKQLGKGFMNFYNKGRNVRFPDENKAKLIDLIKDDFSQVTYSDSAFKSGKKGFFNLRPFKAFSLDMMKTGPTPLTRQIIERPFKSLLRAGSGISKMLFKNPLVNALLKSKVTKTGLFLIDAIFAGQEFYDLFMRPGDNVYTTLHDLYVSINNAYFQNDPEKLKYFITESKGSSKLFGIGPGLTNEQIRKKEIERNLKIKRLKEAAAVEAGSGGNNVIVVPQSGNKRGSGISNNSPTQTGGNEISFVPFEPLNIGDDILLHKLNQ